MKDTTLYQKIKKLIEVSDPAKFRSYDEQLNEGRTYPKPRKAWEVVYTVKIDDGNLTFRESTPLASIYIAGGYQLRIADEPRYTIELRPEGWDAIELVDPFRVKTEHANTEYEILVEGNLAVDLVRQVEDKLYTYNKKTKGEFAEVVKERLEYLKKHMQETDGKWKKREDAQAMVYSAELFDITINVCKEKSGYADNYFVYAKRGHVSVKIDDNALVRELYELIDKLAEVTGLINLEKALEDLRPKSDDDDWSF